MSENAHIQIQLKESSILQVPLKTYEEDFKFIVNGEEFKTSRLYSELLSPKISKCHMNDPTMNEIVINTKHRGDFTILLKLSNFSATTVPQKEIPFLIEILEILGNDAVNVIQHEMNEEYNINSVISKLQIHEDLDSLYFDEIEKEIEFIASHFFELVDNNKEALLKLSTNMLAKIISNASLCLKDEDQLLTFINEIYIRRKEREENENSHDASSCISEMYSHVLFRNVRNKTIHEFICSFDYNDMSNDIWRSICERLENQTNKTEASSSSSRYATHQGLVFVPHGEGKFDGIINHIKRQKSDKFTNTIGITSSSVREQFPPSNAVIYEDTTKEFRTEDEPDSWICFEFKKNLIIPTHYQIRSYRYNPNSCHPKNWVVEGSNDNANWTNLDSQKDCQYLNKPSRSHVFTIAKQTSEPIKYIRIRQTGVNCNGNHHFDFDCVEFYGQLI